MNVLYEHNIKLVLFQLNQTVPFILSNRLNQVLDIIFETQFLVSHQSLQLNDMLVLFVIDSNQYDKEH